MVIGTQNPTVGKQENYQVNDTMSMLNPPNTTYVWYLWKKKNGKWINISEKNPKKGISVTYKFGEKVVGEEFKIQSYKAKPKMFSSEFDAQLFGEILVVPTASKSAEITKVVLFNAGAKDPNKASYRDTLTAQAHCVGMFNKEVEFKLWEDDAAGPGHNATVNKNNQFPNAYKAKVNKNGIAEVKISLAANEKVLKVIADKYLMKGDKDEGANHEFYITASYSGKIKNASQVNVKVARPSANVATFPGTTTLPQKPDKEGKITHAYFIDLKGVPTQKVKVGDSVRIRIKTTGMIGERIQYIVKEYDLLSEHDTIAYNTSMEITADTIDTSIITITPERFERGIDGDTLFLEDADKKQQQYFIEIIPLNSKAKSVSFGINDEAKRMKVDNSKSPAGVKGEKLEKKKEEDKVCECEARVRAFMRMLRFKEGTPGEKGYTTQYSGKQFSDMRKHPEEIITAGGYSSSAAGAYQIITDTWKNLTGHFRDKNNQWAYSEKLDKAKKYSITSFDQESQDKFCLVIMKHNYLQDRSDSFYNPTVWKNKVKKIHDTVKEAEQKEWRKRFKGQQGDIVQMIIDDDIKRATLISSLCWASLPDSPYGQQSATYTFAIVKAIYEKNLKEELIAPNPELHFKKGFLKEYGYGCCGEGTLKDQSISSKCPEDCSQCFEYADVVDNPKINNQSGNNNHNRYHNEARSTGKMHDGVDILAVVGTDVHAMMCGEVVHIRTDLPQDEVHKGKASKGYEAGSYGNTITIKSKDKNGKIIYLYYAHLSRVDVTTGQKVKHSKIIGLSGSTGNAMAVEVKYRHVHVEAGTSYSTKGGSDGKLLAKLGGTMNAENFMKTKFDTKGNPIK